MNDLISRLSEIRSQYNCFDEAEEPYYRALSEAIKKLSERVDEDTISREVAIIQLSHNKCGNDEYDIAVQHDIETIKALPPAHSEQCWIPCSERLPDPYEYCLWTTIDGRVVYHHCDGLFSKYIAWMPLPEPYKERREG